MAVVNNIPSLLTHTGPEWHSLVPIAHVAVFILLILSRLLIREGVEFVEAHGRIVIEQLFEGLGLHAEGLKRGLTLESRLPQVFDGLWLEGNLLD